MPFDLSRIKDVLLLTQKHWQADNVPLYAASLAYYTVFALAPMLVIAVTVAGTFFGRDAVQSRIVEAVGDELGAESADLVQTLIANAFPEASSLPTTLFAVALLLFASSVIFNTLKTVLNNIWGVKADPANGVRNLIMGRALSIVFTLATGILIILILLFNAALNGLSGAVDGITPAGLSLVQLVNVPLQLIIYVLIFGTIFRVLPDVKIGWEDVAVGVFVTSLLFYLGQYAIGLYLSFAGVSSAYGAAGSLVVILVWVFYSTLIVLTGAEFTQAYAEIRGHHIQPGSNAVWLSESHRARHMDRSKDDENEHADYRESPG